MNRPRRLERLIFVLLALWCLVGLVLWRMPDGPPKMVAAIIWFAAISGLFLALFLAAFLRAK